MVVLSELAYLEAEVNLDETDVVRITLGMPVVVTLDAIPGVELSGRSDTEIAAVCRCAHVLAWCCFL